MNEPQLGQQMAPPGATPTLNVDQVLSLRVDALTLAITVSGGDRLVAVETAGMFLHWLLNGNPLAPPSIASVPVEAAVKKALKAPKQTAAAPAAPAIAPVALTAAPTAAATAPPSSPATIPPPTTIQELAGEFKKWVMLDRTGAVQYLNEVYKVAQLAQVPPQHFAALMAQTKIAVAALQARPAPPTSADPLAGIA